MRKINPKIAGVIRHTLAGAGIWLAAEGYLPLDQVEGIVSSLMVITGVGWSIFAKEKKV